MKILVILQAFFVLFSYCWCQTFSVSRRALDPDPVQILTDPVWFSRSRASMERLTHKIKNTKKKTCKLTKKLLK